MTRKRIVFEYVHKYTGYVLIPFVVLAVGTGLYAADAPRWMWLGAVALSLVFTAVFVHLQAKGRCIDTYQAIWGTDPDLPGNRLPNPIGWGIRRVSGK